MQHLELTVIANGNIGICLLGAWCVQLSDHDNITSRPKKKVDMKKKSVQFAVNVDFPLSEGRVLHNIKVNYIQD